MFLHDFLWFFLQTRFCSTIFSPWFRQLPSPPNRGLTIPSRARGRLGTWQGGTSLLGTAPDPTDRSDQSDRSWTGSKISPATCRLPHRGRPKSFFNHGIHGILGVDWRPQPIFNNEIHKKTRSFVKVVALQSTPFPWNFFGSFRAFRCSKKPSLPALRIIQQNLKWSLSLTRNNKEIQCIFHV